MNERCVVLTRHTYYQVVHDLWRALPPPVSDRPDDLACRDNAAIAQVASLLPADPAEAALACKFVAACAHAMDCLGLVNEHAAELAVAMKCRAQAISMMRQACMVRSLLLRIQEARQNRAAPGDTSAAEPAWSDHGIVDRMSEALRRAPHPAPKAGPEGAPEVGTIPGTTEQAFSSRDAHPAPAAVRTEALAEDVQPAQTVSMDETKSQNTSNETLTRLSRLVSPIDDTSNHLPGPHAASRPPRHQNERPEAPFGLIPASFAPLKRNLLASVALTDAMDRTPHPAGAMPRARAA